MRPSCLVAGGGHERELPRRRDRPGRSGTRCGTSPPAPTETVRVLPRTVRRSWPFAAPGRSRPRSVSLPPSTRFPETLATSLGEHLERRGRRGSGGGDRRVGAAVGDRELRRGTCRRRAVVVEPIGPPVAAETICTDDAARRGRDRAAEGRVRAEGDGARRDAQRGRGIGASREGERGNDDDESPAHACIVCREPVGRNLSRRGRGAHRERRGSCRPSARSRRATRSRCASAATRARARRVPRAGTATRIPCARAKTSAVPTIETKAPRNPSTRTPSPR